MGRNLTGAHGISLENLTGGRIQKLTGAGYTGQKLTGWGYAWIVL